DADRIRFLAPGVAQAAADETDDHVMRGDLERVVPQADAASRGRLSGHGDIRLRDAEPRLQIDRARNAEYDNAPGLADGVAERARAGIVQIRDLINAPATSAGRVATK